MTKSSLVIVAASLLFVTRAISAANIILQPGGTSQIGDTTVFCSGTPQDSILSSFCYCTDTDYPAVQEDRTVVERLVYASGRTKDVSLITLNGVLSDCQREMSALRACNQ